MIRLLSGRGLDLGHGGERGVLAPRPGDHLHGNRQAGAAALGFPCDLVDLVAACGSVALFAGLAGGDQAHDFPRGKILEGACTSRRRGHSTIGKRHVRVPGDGLRRAIGRR
jgi:hypothetical protein